MTDPRAVSERQGSESLAAPSRPRMAELIRRLRRWILRVVPAAYLVLCALPYAVLILLVPDPFATPALNYFYPYVDLDDEANLATWFSSSLLLLCALAAAAVVLASRRQTARERLLPSIAALLFLYLSMDETGRLHELLDRMVAHRIVNALMEVEIAPAARVWVFFALPVLALLAWGFAIALRGNPVLLRSCSNCFVLGFGAWAAALLLEVLLGAPMWAAGHLTMYRLEVLVEEGLEVAGTFLFLMGLLHGLEAQLGEGQGPAD
ncbi:MAG: hypothetical protein ABR599_04715 [Gemmatimonadota bacterium]